ncbi:hypothetical protein GT347_03970 [Xylophilus rhododendri]|uniref:Uncharacterized protein n=1 Tax=Xylophilus rhododendri TaxID=2697032 RepID=A0A857J0T3_9BURK|nr:hypothetical protein [Xylophilus rhododendri]QHI97207.1 hypothetical protein GT347_03970 [Xylophilus rhododendri]
MTRRLTDSAISAEQFEALAPQEQLLALLGMIDRYLEGATGHTMDPWHAAKIRHALLKIGKGEVDAAAHDLALADQASHGQAEAGAEHVAVEALRQEAHQARKHLELKTG